VPTLAVALFVLLMAAGGLGARDSHTPIPDGLQGARDPAWAPDGARLALALYDRLFLATPAGVTTGPLVSWAVPVLAERDPSWSPTGTELAFAADIGSGYDIFVVGAAGGAARRVTALAGDERWPSWTPDGRIVFALREGYQWDLAVVDPRSTVPGVAADPHRLSATEDDELEPAVSPDGSRVAFISDRDNEDGGLDVWLMPLPAAGVASVADTAAAAWRVAQTLGDERRPGWAPDGDRVVVSTARSGLGSLWVVTLPGTERGTDIAPAPPPVLVSRHAGHASWSPDGSTLAVAALPREDSAYNGDPLRDVSEPPPLFARGEAFRLWLMPAPRKPDDDVRPLGRARGVQAADWERMFDRVWTTLERLYYRTGVSAETWRRLGRDFGARARAVDSEAAFESLVDEMLLQQPLIKSPVSTRGALVVSGHALASQAGIEALERGGNIIDAAVAVSFALGVVEPDASGIGGDGMALLFLRDMDAPVAVDFKDQAPIRATLDQPQVMQHGRLVADGPAAANIPGLVAGMAHLHRRYGSGKVGWQELLAPAIALAEHGFVLDEALPTTVRRGRQYFTKYPAAARIYLPGGRVPRPGDRFVNPDYGRTLRILADEGPEAFYRGTLARRMAADMAQHGGLIGLDDLAQYRAIERVPVSGTYRGHVVYSAPPPVPTGTGLIEALQILSHYTPAPSARSWTDAEYFHYTLEAWKARQPLRRIADPALWAVDVEQHLDRAHAAERFRRISPTAVLPFDSDLDEPNGVLEEPQEDERLGRGTTAFVVADSHGNMVAVTQTLSTWGGTFYVSDGLGFLYNNHLRSHRTRHGAYGQLLPLARSSSTAAPTLVFRQGIGGVSPWLALGAAGNAWIGTSVYTMLTAIVDGGLSVQQAIEAPRFLVARDPADRQGLKAIVQIEDRIPRRTLDDLEARGHRFVKIGRKGELRYGYAAAVQVDVQAGRVDGGAEPRRSHSAMAWQRADRSSAAP
jgi:gamma-glutamyltranspeptidase